MKLINKGIKFWIIVFLTLLFAQVCQAGLGISPSLWIEEHVLPGSSIEKTFTLSRAEPKEDLYFSVQIEGEIKDWIQIDKGLEFVMPKGKQQFPIKVKINIPENAEYREYQSEIRLISQPPKIKESGGIGIALSALIQIRITVSEKEVLNYEVLQITIPKQTVNEVLNLNLKIWNKGNVPAKPTKVIIDFWDKYKQNKLASKEINITELSNIEAVAPFSEGEMNVSFPLQLQPEQYWANVRIYQGKTLLKSNDIFFELISSVGSAVENMTQGGEVAADKISPFFNFFLLLLGLIVIFFLFFSWKKTKKKTKQKTKKSRQIKY